MSHILFQSFSCGYHFQENLLHLNPHINDVKAKLQKHMNTSPVGQIINHKDMSSLDVVDSYC